MCSPLHETLNLVLFLLLTGGGSTGPIRGNVRENILVWFCVQFNLIFYVLYFIHELWHHCRLRHVPFHQTICKIFEWKVWSLQRNSHGLLQSQKRVSCNNSLTDQILNIIFIAVKKEEHCGPWQERSYSRQCQFFRTKLMLCSSLTALQRWEATQICLTVTVT